MLSNMATSLILHKRIETTLAKAKELRKFVEPLITKAKNDSTHSRRIVFSYLQDKESIKTLFDEVAEKVAARPGGYTRIIKLGNRLGDNAETCLIELVDYNETMLKPVADKTKPAEAEEVGVKKFQRLRTNNQRPVLTTHLLNLQLPLRKKHKTINKTNKHWINFYITGIWLRSNPFLLF
jgi:ribosomal protein L17